MSYNENQAMPLAWSRGSMTPSDICLRGSSLRYPQEILLGLQNRSWEVPLKIPFLGSKGIPTYNH